MATAQGRSFRANGGDHARDGRLRQVGTCVARGEGTACHDLELQRCATRKRGLNEVEQRSAAEQMSLGQGQAAALGGRFKVQA